MDPKFGSELVTKKGKVFKFDDIGCMVRFMKSGTIDQSELSQVLVVNYKTENDLLDVNSCTFVVGEDIKSPMNFNAAAFTDAETANNFGIQNGRKILDWKTIYENIE